VPCLKLGDTVSWILIASLPILGHGHQSIGSVVGASWGEVGPAWTSWGHLEAMLGQLARVLGLMLGHVDPS